MRLAALVAPSRRAFLYWAIAIFVFAELLFLVGIQFPRGTNFDEFHYVPAAKMFLEGTGFRNLEHPPLVKAILAVGIAIGGDRPFGWRFMSTIFGAFTLLGVFFWARVFFKRNLKLCLFVVGVTLFNHLLFVQARIAMLDTFMECFLLWACALFCWSWDKSLEPPGESAGRFSPTAFHGLIASGVCFGLAAGCKWFGFVGWMGCLGMALVGWAGQRFGIRGIVDAWPRWKLREIWLGLGLAMFVAYWATYLPLYLVADANYSLTRFFTLHPEMWDAQQRVPGKHNYRSVWSQWPLLSRPMWYQFDAEPTNSAEVRGVALIGNPWVMWTGVVAVLVSTWLWIRNQSRYAMWIAAFYSLFFLSWVFIPRALTFYYYYYPAGMLLGLAVGYVLQNRSERLRWTYLAFTALIFIYFYPILAAVKIPMPSFYRWMWFRSWI